MKLINDEKNTILNIIIIDGGNKSLNRKTSNSLDHLRDFPLNIIWISSLDDFSKISDVDHYSFYMFMQGGDHITRSFMDSFFNNTINYHFAYQPEYSYIFGQRGGVFYRKNIDITPNTSEINALMLYPHHSRHIIFSGKFIVSFIGEQDGIGNNFFWNLAQYLIENNIAIISLLSCITLERYNIDNLNSKEQIYLFSDPSNSSVLKKDALFINQSFSDLYE